MRELPSLLNSVSVHAHGWQYAVVALSVLMAMDSCTPMKTEVKKLRAEKPNILVILADYLGINDLGAYGNSDVRTPNIDRLAEAGFRFTRFYTAGDVCPPTRASLLTGIYPQRLGFTVGSPRGLSEEVVTLPELLRDASYSTHHIGKWHLGYTLEQVLPLAQGYDTYFGFLHTRFLQPRLPDGLRPPTYRNPLLISGGGDPTQYTGHLTDLLTDRVVNQLHESQGTQPWFMNLWYFAPHSPIQPPARWIERYPKTRQGKYYRALSKFKLENYLGARRPSGNIGFTRHGQEHLTKLARAIIADDERLYASQQLDESDS